MLVSYLKYSSRNHLYSRQDAYFSSAKQRQPGRVESLREKPIETLKDPFRSFFAATELTLKNS